MTEKSLSLAESSFQWIFLMFSGSAFPPIEYMYVYLKLEHRVKECILEKLSVCSMGI